VYGDVPPLGEVEAAPLLPPKHETAVPVVTVLSTEGCVTVKVCVVVEPMLSVTVTVYVPAARPDAVAAVPPDGAHEYEYGLEPPEGAAVNDAVD
jgi:hypothetical protein